jgi:3-dehydroquinate synthase
MWSDELIEEAAPVASLVRGGEGIAEEAGRWLAAAGWRGPGLVVVDAAVAGRIAPVTTNLGRHGLEPAVVVLPGGEGQKSWPVVSSLYDAALLAGVARDGWLLAVGGGALSDAAGFAAATYLRGIAWGILPTTLLAQVDAALGGKTAIDLPQGKNLVGAFHMPRVVLVDPAWLESLPPREWRSGFGEVLKAALLTGEPLWSTVRTLAVGRRGPELAVAIERAARYKLRVVREDPREAGPRAHLNLGHTLGHALEAWSVAASKPMAHGEAVGVGLLGALWLSERVWGLPAALAREVQALLARWDMPTRLPPVPAAELLAYMGRDKKRQGKIVRWVLLRDLGQPDVTAVDPDLVEGMLEALGAIGAGREA